MENVTPNQMSVFFYVGFAIIAGLVMVDKLLDLIKKWRSPSVDVDRKLANDKVRLDEHDDAITELRGSGRIQCTALVALLDHELHDGNSDQMEKARDDLMRYLTNK